MILPRQLSGRAKWSLEKIRRTCMDGCQMGHAVMAALISMPVFRRAYCDGERKLASIARTCATIVEAWTQKDPSPTHEDAGNSPVHLQSNHHRETFTALTTCCIHHPGALLLGRTWLAVEPKSAKAIQGRFKVANHRFLPSVPLLLHKPQPSGRL